MHSSSLRHDARVPGALLECLPSEDPPSCCEVTGRWPLSSEFAMNTILNAIGMEFGKSLGFASGQYPAMSHGIADRTGILGNGESVTGGF